MSNCRSLVFLFSLSLSSRLVRPNGGTPVVVRSRFLVFSFAFRPLDHVLVAGAGQGLTYVGRAISWAFPVTLPGELGGTLLLDLGE